MKIDLKVPCSVDMSVINAQMAIVEQKKAELKEAIDALANSSVELVFSNVKPNAERTTIPEAEQQPSKKTTLLRDAFFKKASEATTDTVIADLWDDWDSGDVYQLIDEFFEIAFEVFCNSTIAKDSQSQMNVPDYPEWRDLLKQNNAHILEAGDDYLDQQELDVALRHVYLLSKEFFGK